MKINWFTVLAQVINFLILVWLLKRYLYKPILNAIDKREKNIVAKLEDANAKKAEALKERDEFNQKNEDFNLQKNKLMNTAIAETEEERKKLLEAARTTATALENQLKKALEEKQENLNQEILQKIQQEVFVIARKTLTDLSSISLEEQVVNIFIQRLNDLKADEKKAFISAFKANPKQILVQSAFDLTKPLQSKIQKTVNAILGKEIEFEFKTAAEIISGIELTANGYKLSWSISEYLDSLEKSFSEIINKK